MNRRVGAVLLVLTALACDRRGPEEPAAIPVRFEVAKRAPFAPALTLLGVVRAARTIPLEAVQGGTVVYPRRFAGGLQTGARVRRGETIAELRNDQVILHRTQARLQLEAANAEFERARLSFEAGVVSGSEFSARKVAAELAREAYAAAQRENARLSIVAPESGTLVVAKLMAPGVNVAAGTVLAEIASGGAPIIESGVAAGDRALLRPGLMARFGAADSRIGNARARIVEVAGVIDASGTARVVATIESGSVPLPGTGVELQVELDRRPEVLTVPEEAIVAAGDGPAVFVASTSAEGFRSFTRVKRVAVETGGRAGGRVEIVSGLRDGDRVVVSGADALSDDVVVGDAEAAQ
jgi:RND family efflux transporter MFP subunit